MFKFVLWKQLINDMSNNILENEEFIKFLEHEEKVLSVSLGVVDVQSHLLSKKIAAKKAEQILTKQFEEDRERFDNWKRYKIAILELHVDAAIWVYKGLRTTTKELYELYKKESEGVDE